MTPIDWKLLARAQDHYSSLGYQSVDVPWVVTPQVSQKTFHGRGILCDMGALVGSAEQGFLAGKYPMGRFQSITPCFRDETHHDDVVRPYFMKLELYSEQLFPHYDKLMGDAYGFFSQFARCEISVTPEGHDIMSNGLEIGSYGCRSVEGRNWVYGTGIALPRASIAFHSPPASPPPLSWYPSEVTL